MSRQRFIALLVAAALAISAAMYLSTQRNLQRDPRGGMLLPTLAGELNSVTALSVRRGSPTPTVTLRLQAGRWTVAERGDYPADVSKLRKLLLALSEAKIVEEKTSNPASFPIIGVDDPSVPGASGAEISVTAKDAKHTVIVGKPVGGGNFARRGGENTSYSVEPAISFETEPKYWIDSKLLDVAPATIQIIQVKPAAGAAYTVRREAAAAAASAAGAKAPLKAASGATFTLEGVPPGRMAADAAALAPSPTAYGGLTVDDVAPASGIDFNNGTVLTLTLSDGNTITLTGAVVGDKHWIQVQSGKDTDLDAKTAGRAYEIAGYRYDAIFRPLEQLLVPKPPPPAAKPSKAAPKKPVPAPKS